jgi:rRNA maturation protein Nop10
MSTASASMWGGGALSTVASIPCPLKMSKKYEKYRLEILKKGKWAYLALLNNI